MCEFEYKLIDHIQHNYKQELILTWDYFANIRDSEIWGKLSSEKVIINFNGLDYITNDGMIWIVSLLHHRNLLGLETEIILPENKRLLAYLINCGFIHYQYMLNASFQNEEKLPKKIIKSDRSIERINYVDRNYEANGNLFAEDVEKYFKDSLHKRIMVYENGCDPVTIKKFVKELLQNIARYGDSQNPNYIRWDNTIFGFFAFSEPRGNYPWARISFADLGCGFKKTLLQKEKHEIYLNECRTDRDAILSALLYRYFDPADGILGYYGILGFVKLNRGRIGIRSGYGYQIINFADVTMHPEFEKQYRNNPNYKWLSNFCTYYKLKPTLGTKVYIDFSIKE